ncbi:MAG: hypothetical protein HZA78_09530 [Candidatus Schekmanbacteria bacterium]|nr:hypothetical protein [Candidatus Schekmanbacteria bacterium]
MTKSALFSYLEGYKLADKIIKKEKKQRLSQMTFEESLLEFNNLCLTWESVSNKEGMDNLEKRKITFLIEQRARLDKAGSRKVKNESIR